LAEETLLTDDFLRQLINVGEVDILVGLPTYNNAKTIEPVLRTIQAGILKCFPRERVVIINADGGSHDGTAEMVTGASIDDVRNAAKLYTLRTLHVVSTRYARAPDPAVALRTIIAAADLLQAKSSVMISPSATTIDPDWLQRIARPVYSDGFDLVSPIYQRPKFEGVLLHNLLYPTTRAVYGHRIREPYASEFAISGRLATDFLNQETAGTGAPTLAAEMSLTAMALTGKYRVGQAYLGTKAHVHRSPADLVEIMRRTVGSLFSSMEGTFPAWSKISGSEAISTMGTPAEISNLEPARINRKRLFEMFGTGVAELAPIYRSILAEATFSEILKIAGSQIGDFSYPAEMWTKTVYEFASSYHKTVINRDHIIQALVPLYRGRMLAFLLENREASAQDIDQSVESLCNEFERMKPYLLEKWVDGK
jgi:glucosylglycerate synthase